MRLIKVFVFLMLPFLIFGCASNDEITEAQPEGAEEEVEKSIPEEEIAEPDPNLLYYSKFIGMTEEEVLECFDEEATTMDIINPHHVFYEEQNIAFLFDEGEVVNAAIFEGNEILGIKIEGEYDENVIIGKLGDPDGKGVFQGTKYMNYFVGEYVVIFFKDYNEQPFSAGVGPKHLFREP